MPAVNLRRLRRAGNIVRIEHRTRGMISPICLKVRLPHPVHDAILAVFDSRPTIEGPA